LTFNPGSGRDVDAWLMTEPEFPVIGFDPYTDEYGTSPARITQSTFSMVTTKLEAEGKRMAIAECGGIVGSTAVRPPELWEGFAQECLDHDILACCWFDLLNGTANASPGDPSGDLYAAITASLDSTVAYREGLLWEPAPPPGPTWVLGAPREVGFPEISGDPSSPVVEFHMPTSSTIQADSTVSFTKYGPVGSNSDANIIGVIELTIPNDETWDVTISFDVTPISVNRTFNALLISGNPGLAPSVLDIASFDTTPGATSPQTLSLAGRCVGSLSLF
jgi:hypothetical protein